MQSSKLDQKQTANRTCYLGPEQFKSTIVGCEHYGNVSSGGFGGFQNDSETFLYFRNTTKRYKNTNSRGCHSLDHHFGTSEVGFQNHH
jgi:hypothetical protein